MDRALPKSGVTSGPVGAQMSIASWLAQRWTGILLIVFLVAHLIVAHFVAVSPTTGDWSAGEVSSRLVNGWYKALDIGLLALALYHGLNGAARVAVAAGHVGSRGKLIIVSVCWIIGIALLVFGVIVFNALLG
jgi:succinate dehydrogenase hydrophobic anchor subunit